MLCIQFYTKFDAKLYALYSISHQIWCEIENKAILTNLILHLYLMQNCMLYIQFFTKFGAKSKTKHTILHLIVKIRNLVRNQKQNIRFRTKYRFFFNYLNSSKFEYSHEDLLLKAFAPAFRIFFLCSRSIMSISLILFGNILTNTGVPPFIPIVFIIMKKKLPSGFGLFTVFCQSCKKCIELFRSFSAALNIAAVGFSGSSLMTKCSSRNSLQIFVMVRIFWRSRLV